MSYNTSQALIQDITTRMDKAARAVADNLAKLRTGRANAGILDHVYVDYYEMQTPLNQLASVTTPDSRTILIQPFDPSTVTQIEKAILQSGLGLTPNTTGDAHQRLIRIIIPELSQERRKELVKVAKREAEEGRVAIRNIRRDANEGLKGLEKKHVLTQDELHREQEHVQKMTDKYIEKIDQFLAHKEAELMQV